MHAQDLLAAGDVRVRHSDLTVEAAGTQYPAASLTARPRAGLFVGKDEVKAAIGDADACTINALAPDLHSGENPRYGRPGRIPGSVNVPVLDLVDAASLTIRPPEATMTNIAYITQKTGVRIASRGLRSTFVWGRRRLLRWIGAAETGLRSRKARARTIAPWPIPTRSRAAEIHQNDAPAPMRWSTRTISARPTTMASSAPTMMPRPWRIV